MDACQFYLLGSPHLIRCAQPLAISRRKQWGILAYLLLTRRPLERDVLAALLWPTYSQSCARADLRRELARLRHILPDVIACSHTEVALEDGAPLWVDVWAYEEHVAAVKTHEHPPETWCAACHEHLHAARALYAGDLLGGYTIADSPGFEEWHFFQQESLRGELLDVLSRLAVLEMAGGRLADAIAPLRERLAIDPLHEESHRRLIWLFTHTNQRAAALRQFGECKAVLARELGVEPEPETVALYRQLKLLAPQSVPTQTSAETQADVQQYEPALAPLFGANRIRRRQEPAGRCFVGRQRELAELAAHVDCVCAGCGRVVFVSGETGAGKTALLEEFAYRALAQHAGLIVAAGSATVPDATGTPLLPFRDALAMLAGDTATQAAEWQPSDMQVARLHALVPHVLHTLVTTGPHLVGSLVAGGRLLEAARTAYLEDSGDYTLLQALTSAAMAPGAIAGDSTAGPELHRIVLAETAAVLEELARIQPLVLLLDNIHWADAASLNLIFHMGKRLRTEAILIVCAYRPGELVSFAQPGLYMAPTCHPLQALIHEFTRDFGRVQIDLDAETPAPDREGMLPEDLAWVEALLAAHSCPPSPVLRDALFARTRGQPLFTVELLEAWRANGWLADTGNQAWLAQHGRELDVVPPRTAAAIQRRLDRLNDEAAQLLAAAAALGATFSLSALAAAVGWNERRALEVLAGELHHRHRLVVEAGPTGVPEETAVDGTRADLESMRYRFTNPMIRTYLYAGLDTGERLLYAGKISALGTPPGTQAGRTPATLKLGRADSQAASAQSTQPFSPLAEITPSQRSVRMYHRWHLNYPFLILILAILLAVWAVSYTVATAPGFNISSLWQQAPAAVPVSRADMIEVAPALYVPRDYYTQEKTYRAPVILVLAPGYQVPQDYFIQEKTYTEPAFVEVAPGFKVPQGYYIQEKTYREEPTQ